MFQCGGLWSTVNGVRERAMAIIWRTSRVRGWKRMSLALLLGCCLFYLSMLTVLEEAEDGQTWVDFPVNYSRFVSGALQRAATNDTLKTTCRLETPATSRHVLVDLRVIVITFGRPRSLERILRSLDEAEYGTDRVLVEIWVDRSTHGQLSNQTLAVAQNFRFKAARCHLIVHTVHVGIRGQWLNVSILF